MFQSAATLPKGTKLCTCKKCPPGGKPVPTSTYYRHMKAGSDNADPTYTPQLQNLLNAHMERGMPNGRSAATLARGPAPRTVLRSRKRAASTAAPNVEPGSVSK